MNETTPALKAEERNGNENGEQKTENTIPQGMADGEREFLATLIQFMRGLKRSQDRAVARAAREWEGTIAFRIRLTMQSRKRRTGSGPKRMEGGRWKMERDA
jgi:hypothetical protein